jgi:DMSO reductase anchor subunit
MHPALSVILFTTASGAGYGLLALLGVLGPMGVLPSDRWFGLIAFALAFLPITFGLLSSTFHLGHPERAWRAMSQWRSSWLSREGLLAIVTYLPAGLFALGWVVFERSDGIWAVFGVAAALLSAATVYATAMIYRSLKPIQRWCNGWTVPNYLLLGLMTGALWLHALLALHGVPHRGLALLALGAIICAALVKWRYWRFIDGTQSASTAESATGLGALGKVRLLESPHSGDSYIQREMGFRVARKHAAKLRRIAALLAFVAPMVLLVVGGLGDGWTTAVAASLAAISATIGVLVERWLFFAEAKHAVTLYYGADTA